MEFLLQLIAEMFGTEPGVESETAMTTMVETEKDEELQQSLDQKEEIEPVPSFFGVMQFH
jgi:hypothetical protein